MELGKINSNENETWYYIQNNISNDERFKSHLNNALRFFHELTIITLTEKMEMTYQWSSELSSKRSIEMINEITWSISQDTESNMILFRIMEKHMQDSSNIMDNTEKEVKKNSYW
jgi:hypothetical protein